jgi:sialate O-acetylesterase
MAVAIDIGDAGNIHPPNKQDVGRRLALAARGVAYGEKGLVHSGPIYESHKVEGGKIRVKFTRAGSGLIAGPPEGAITVNPPKNTNAGTTELLGFAVAGQDKVFHWADAVIEANDVLVSCAKVPRPVAVRYGWAANPECNLYNRNGLPASPFRTDDWPPR